MDNTKDIAEESWFGKWPDWLRWSLFLPLAILGSLLGSALFFLIVSFSVDTSSGTLDGGWYRLVQSAIFGGLFVYIGSYISPRNQFAVGIILLIIATIAISAVTTLTVFLPEVNVWYQLLHSAVFLLGGGISLYAIYEELN